MRYSLRLLKNILLLNKCDIIETDFWNPNNIVEEGVRMKANNHVFATVLAVIAILASLGIVQFASAGN